MSQVFVSYSHRDRQPVERIAGGLETSGYRVWWDRQLRAHQTYTPEIETALEQSRCAVVAWSATARDSLWVCAEANAAYESGKLVQVSLDGERPPLPFTMIHLLNLSAWSGRTDDPPWNELAEAVQAVISGELPAPKEARRAARPRGLNRSVVIGAASLGLVVLAGGLIAAGTSGAFSTDLFGLVSGAMFFAALLGFGYMLMRIIKTALASR